MYPAGISAIEEGRVSNGKRVASYPAFVSSMIFLMFYDRSVAPAKKASSPSYGV